MTNVIHRLKSAFAVSEVAESLPAEELERDRSGDESDSDENKDGGVEQLTLF